MRFEDLVRKNRQTLKALENRLGGWIKGGRFWVEFECPFCDDHGHHLGLDLRSMGMNCLKCGTVPRITNIIKAPLRPRKKKEESVWDQRPEPEFRQRFLRDDKELFTSLSHARGSVLASIAREYVRERCAYDWADKPFIGVSRAEYLTGRLITIFTEDGRWKYFEAIKIARSGCRGPKSLQPDPDEGWCNKGDVLLGYDWVHPGTELIVLVEGVKDAWILPPNTPVTLLPLLGKKMSGVQINKLRLFGFPVIVALDPDAREEAVALALQLHIQQIETSMLDWPEGSGDPNETGLRFLDLIFQNTTPVLNNYGDLTAELHHLMRKRVVEAGRKRRKR